MPLTPDQLQAILDRDMPGYRVITAPTPLASREPDTIAPSIDFLRLEYFGTTMPVSQSVDEPVTNHTSQMAFVRGADGRELSIVIKDGRITGAQG